MNQLVCVCAEIFPLIRRAGQWRVGTRALFCVLFGSLLGGCSALSVPSSASMADLEDADSDGIVNVADDCPDSSSLAVVGEDGCELLNRSIDAIAFQPGDDGLDLAARNALDDIVVALTRRPELLIRVEGHTDNRGRARDNLELSKRRVMAVVRYLVANGVDGRRLEPFGFGESRPRVSNATPEGRKNNRRIEMHVVSTATEAELTESTNP